MTEEEKENLLEVKEWLEVHGPIPAVRVSSAKAKGKASKYSYWGAVRYRIVLSSDGYPQAKPCGCAGSDRRSLRLAFLDAEAMAKDCGGVVIESVGKLSDDDVHIAYRWVEARWRGETT